MLARVKHTSLLHQNVNYITKGFLTLVGSTSAASFSQLSISSTDKESISNVGDEIRGEEMGSNYLKELETL